MFLKRLSDTPAHLVAAETGLQAHLSNKWILTALYNYMWHGMCETSTSRPNHCQHKWRHYSPNYCQ
jgi:hypothetical protein